MGEDAGGRRKRTPRRLMQVLGRQLYAAGEHPRGYRDEVASGLGVSVRTLWNWERWAEKEATGEELPRPAGRPPHPAHELRRAQRTVANEWERQGRSVGRRSMERALEDLPEEKRPAIRLVREALRTLKAAARHLDYEANREVRVSHDVLARDAIWGEDALYVGRGDVGRVEAEIVRDPGPGRTIGLRVGPAATEEDVIALLEETARARGGFPLVFQHDRGGAYRGEKLAALLEEHLVIHLLSRPRTPTDNPQTERSIRDLRAESDVDGHGRGVDLQAVREAFDAARRTLDLNRRHARHGYKRAIDVDAAMPRADAVVPRETFHREAKEAMAAALARATSAREAFRLVREAVWGALERFALVRVRSPAAASSAPRSTQSRRAATVAAGPIEPKPGGVTGRPDSRSSFLRQMSRSAERVEDPAGCREASRGRDRPADGPGRAAPWACRPVSRSHGPAPIGEGLAELLLQLKPRARPAPSPCSDAGTLVARTPGGCARTPQALCSP